MIKKIDAIEGFEMRWFRYIAFLSVSCLLVACLHSGTPPTAVPTNPTGSSILPSPEKTLEYKLHQLPHSIVHTLRIPAQSRFVVLPALSPQLKTVEQFAESTGAIAVLNGGFFDPQNQKSTSAIVMQGKAIAKPEDNERLMTNLDLIPYLDKILNRSELRHYQCGTTIHYAIAPRQAIPPANCQLEAALGAGPQLLPDLRLQQEGFVAVQNGQVVRDAIGSAQPNARSAVGITADGSMIWVVAAQRPKTAEGAGLSLPELAHFMKQLGVEQGLNLDGGSSSALYFQGETFYGKLDTAGEPLDRPVKSVLVVQATKTPGA